VVAPTFVAAELGQAPLEEAPLASETNGGPEYGHLTADGVSATVKSWSRPPPSADLVDR
jgi:hypothetical protein